MILRAKALPSGRRGVGTVEWILKTHLRRIGTHSFSAVVEAIGEICELFDPKECWTYFKAAGYVSN